MQPRLSKNDRHDVLRIVAIYAVFSCLWIYLSDTILGLVISHPATIIRLSEFKGFLFIAVSVGLLYHLIGQYLRKIRQTEAALHTEKIGHGLLIEHLPVGVVIYTADTRIVSSNPEAEKILGLPAEQLLGRFATDSVAIVKDRSPDCDCTTADSAVTFTVSLVPPTSSTIGAMPSLSPGLTWMPPRLVVLKPDNDTSTA